MDKQWLTLPTTITMFSHTYRVALEDNLAGSAHVLGQVNFYDQTIAIESGLEVAAQWAVLLHEALHVVNYQLSLGLSEAKVAQLGTGLFEFVWPYFVAAPTITNEEEHGQ